MAATGIRAYRRTAGVKGIEELYSLIAGGSRRAFNYFDANALGDAHKEAFRAARPLSKRTRARVVGNYLALLTRVTYYDRFMGEVREYHALHVVGVDDATGKFFCHRLPWQKQFEEQGFLERLDERSLREMMGFHSHLWEAEFRDGERVRVQGDLVMTVVKTFRSLGELEEYIKGEIESRLAREAMLEEMYKVANEIYRKLEEVARSPRRGINRLLRDVLRREYERHGIDIDIEEKYGRKRLYGILPYTRGKKGLKISRDDILYDISHSNLPDEVEAEITASPGFRAAVQQALEEHVGKLCESEARVRVEAGNHVVTLVAVPIRSPLHAPPRSPYLPTPVAGLSRTRRGRVVTLWSQGGAVTFLVLRQQEIVVEHPEHGTAVVPVRGPAILTFSFLHRHLRP